MNPFSHRFTANTLELNMSGIVTNEGVRDTLIKGIEFRYTFSRKDQRKIVLVVENLPSARAHFTKEHLIEKESTSFAFSDTLSLDIVLHYDAIPQSFSDFTLVIFHDDGFGLLSNSRSIPIS